MTPRRLRSLMTRTVRPPQRRPVRPALEPLEGRVVPAGTHTWTGAVSSLWSAAGNWTGGAPSGNNNTLIFPAVANETSTNDLGGIGVSELDLQAPGYTIDGNAVSLTGNGIQDTAASGSNTVNLRLNLNASVPVNVAAGTTLNLGGLITGGIAQTLTYKGGGTVNVSRNNTYQGLTVILGGLVVAQSNNALGTADQGTQVQPGATLRIDTGVNYSTAEPFSLWGTPAAGQNGSLVGGSGAKFAAPITVLQDTVIAADAGPNPFTLNGIIDLNARTLTFAAATGAAITANGTIFDSTPTNLGGLVIGPAGTNDGKGTVTLGASNTYRGLTDIRSGVVIAGADAALGTADTGTNVKPGSTLKIANGVNYTTAEPVALFGTPAAGQNGDLVLGGGGATFAGFITALQDTVVAQDSGTGVLAGGLFDLNGRKVTFAAATGATLRVNEIIEDSTGTNGGALIKGPAGANDGKGVVRLQKNNTYTDPTIVNTGTLLVDGNQPNSPVTVNAGGTLGGNGKVGALKVPGGTVAPGGVNAGNSIDVLKAVSADFTGGGVLLVQINNAGAGAVAGTDFDQLQVTNGLTLDATSGLTVDTTNYTGSTTPLPVSVVTFNSRTGTFGVLNQVGPLGFTVQSFAKHIDVQLNFAPQITLQPADQTVTAGQTVTFTAAANGQPAPTVQWQVSTNGGLTFTDIPGATSTTLSFTATTAQNGNLYRAVFTNAVGSTATDAATLTVNLTAKITPVTPNPRSTQVSSVTITFDEPVSGFTLANLQLTRNGMTIPLSSSARLTTADGGMTWVLSGLIPLTSAFGNYTLTLLPAGITSQVSGLPLAASTSTSWIIQPPA